MQAPVVQKVDNAIHRINHYPLDRAIIINNIGFASVYPLDSTIHCFNNWHVIIFIILLSGVGDGNGCDLSFEIIINGTTVFKMELVKSRDGQVRKRG